MNFFLLGSGYIGSGLLHTKRPGYHFLVSTTSSEKVKELSCFTDNVLVSKGNELKKLIPFLEKAEGMGIFVAPAFGGSYKETYLETAITLASYLKQRKKPFYLLYTSSTFVYESLGGITAHEDLCLTPKEEKARILLDTENTYLSAASQAIKVCVLRLGGIYGPERELKHRAQKILQHPLAGDGSRPTNHIHLEDVLSAVFFCIENQLTGIYNLVNDSHPTKKELYHSLAQSLNLPPPKWNPEKKEQHGCGCIVSNQKIKDAGFSFLHSNI